MSYAARIEYANRDGDVCNCVSHVSYVRAASFSELLTALQPFKNEKILAVTIKSEE